MLRAAVAALALAALCAAPMARAEFCGAYSSNATGACVPCSGTTDPGCEPPTLQLRPERQGGFPHIAGKVGINVSHPRDASPPYTWWLQTVGGSVVANGTGGGSPDAAFSWIPYDAMLAALDGSVQADVKIIVLAQSYAANLGTTEVTVPVRSASPPWRAKQWPP